MGRGFEHVNQAHQWDVQPVDGVGLMIRFVAEKVISNEPFLVVDVLLGPMADDHVVHTLERVARDLRLVAHDLEVILEGTLPIQIPIQIVVLHFRDRIDHAHLRFTHR